MAFVVAVQVDLANSETGFTLVRVNNTESVVMPNGGKSAPLFGELVASVMERLAEDVKNRASEQARALGEGPS